MHALKNFEVTVEQTIVKRFKKVFAAAGAAELNDTLTEDLDPLDDTWTDGGEVLRDECISDVKLLPTTPPAPEVSAAVEVQ